MTNDAAPTLLLVSDDLMTASRVREGAKPAGYTVTVAGTEAAAKTALEAAPVAVLVSLMVRRFDAVAFIRFVKETHPAIPVLAFAGHVERELHAQAREAGADLVSANSSVAMHLPALLSRLLSGNPFDEPDTDHTPDA